MKITVTDAQRAGLAMFLAHDWGGPEGVLYALDAACDAFNTDEFEATAKGFIPKDSFDPAATTEVEVTEEVASLILAHYPASPTPVAMGLARAKVKLLRGLRALVTKKE